MSILSRPTALISALGAVLVVGLVTFWVVQGGDATQAPPAIDIDAASRSTLESFGVVLAAPVEGVDEPAINVQTAEKAALNEFPGEVTERVLARADDYHTTPPVQCLCWIFAVKPKDGNFAPSGGPVGNDSKPEEYDFLVILVDARTGLFIEALAGHK